MKVSGNFRLGLLGAIIALHLVITLIFYYILMPYALPANAAVPAGPLAEMRFNLAVYSFIAAVLSALLVVFVILRLCPSGYSVKELADAIRNPFVLLDGSNRLVLCNRNAERVLGLSCERETGKAMERDFVEALARGVSPTDGLDARGIINRGGRQYLVLDHPLPENRQHGRQRVVLLRDVTNHLRLREAIAHINDTVGVLVSNTQKISGSAASLSSGATQQASSLSAISSSLDEFSQKIQGNADSAEKSTQLAAQAREAAERSGNEIAHALTAMTDVQDAGIRIARIVKLIDDIAFQTNLLALNAAVEAARAGRQGKGFAVVAGEVRNLAGRSAKAAKDTASMVEDVTERIGNASNYISKLEEMLRNIVQDAIRMADSSASATATSAEQATAILQVNRELGQVSSVTRATMSEAEQTAAAVGALVRQVDEIKDMLQDVTSEFQAESTRNEDAHRPASGTPTINLYDAPPPFATHGAGTQQYGMPGDQYSAPASRSASGASAEDDDFVAPFKKMAATRDWDLNATAADGDQTLSNLLRSDGYNKQYEDFLRENQTPKPPPTGFRRRDPADEPTEYKTTSDGDKVVKPGQSIHLDDSEFGRY